MEKPKNKTTREPVSKKIPAAGMWLPCGRTNFVDTREDRSLISDLLIEHCKKGVPLDELQSLKTKRREEGEEAVSSQLECSVLRRMCMALKDFGFGKIMLVEPEYLREAMGKADDPEGLYAYIEVFEYKPFGDGRSVQMQLEDRPVFYLKNIHFLMDHNGFYLCWLTGQQEKGVDKRLLEVFLIDLLQGWDTLLPKIDNDKEAAYPYTVNVEARYNGILNFSQLNMIMEGLCNYFFDTDVFFELKKSDDQKFKEHLKKYYGLFDFFDSIVTPVSLHNEQLAQISRSKKPSLNDLLPTQVAHFNVIEEILRQFLLGTSVNIQSMKWTVERCRRQLLNEMISEAHRRHDILQIKTQFEDKKQPNSALLRGYIMFLGAKMPILLNVQQHLTAIKAEGEIKHEDPNHPSMLLRKCINHASVNLSELIYSWNSLVDGLNKNVTSIDYAISQARQDRILHEQEQIRAEQEATAESARIRERSGNSSISMDEEASARGANLLAIISVALAVVAIVLQGVDPKLGTSEGSSIFQIIEGWAEDFVNLLNGLPPILILIALGIFLVGFAFFSFVLQYFLNEALHKISSIWRKFFGVVATYYYEIDARIEQHINPKVRSMIFEGNPKEWAEHSKEKNRLKSDEPVDGANYFDLGIKTKGIIIDFISFFGWMLLGLPPVYCQKKHVFGLANLKRKYYRVERSRDDEALHKINFEAQLVVPIPEPLKRWQIRPRIIGFWIIAILCFLCYSDDALHNSRAWITELGIAFWLSIGFLCWRAAWHREHIPCHFTYEFLFHRNSSDNNKFVMRELRFVVHDFQRELTLDESMHLKMAIIHTLINTWVDNQFYVDPAKNAYREPITAFLAPLNYKSEMKKDERKKTLEN